MRMLRKPFEAGGFLLLKWTIPLLPRRLVTAFAQGAGRLMWLLPTREKKYGLINLDAVFGDTLSAAEKRRILVSSFATFTQTMLDVFWFSRNPGKRIPAYVDFEESPNLDVLLGSGPGVCITAHMGSWELIGQAVALRGVDLASIAATLKNRTVNRILIEQRERTGQTIIPQQGALRSLIARFRNNGKAAFVLDQNTDPEDGGIPVDFLGLPMSVSAAPAALAYRTGTDIMFGFCLPRPGGRYRVHAPAILHPPPFSKERDADEVTLELTRRIQERISSEIRAHPEFWLWSYKHWRRRPGQAYPPGYPDYDGTV